MNNNDNNEPTTMNNKYKQLFLAHLHRLMCWPASIMRTYTTVLLITSVTERDYTLTMTIQLCKHSPPTLHTLTTESRSLHRPPPPTPTTPLGWLVSSQRWPTQHTVSMGVKVVCQRLPHVILTLAQDILSPRTTSGICMRTSRKLS